MGVYGHAIFYIVIYLPFYFIFSLIQKLYWLCNGMSDIISQIDEGLLYERSAHVFDIRCKLRKEPFHLLSRRNFIATHRSFEHPNYVLSHNVSLLVLQMDYALFVEVPHNYDIFDCHQSPFIHNGQFSESIRIITMPITSLIRCAADLGDPKCKVVWLHSTGRCGSTAMSIVFDSIPNCTTLSEPMCLFTARNEASMIYNTKTYRKYVTSDTYRNMVVATTRMMCKPNQHNSDILFIKNQTMSGVFDVPILEKEFPDHYQLYLYRDCLNTVQSHIRSLNQHFFLDIILKLRSNACLRYLIRTPAILLRSLAAPDTIDSNAWLKESKNQLAMTGFGLLVIQWACYCHHYSQLVTDNKSKVRAIRYEDVVGSKHATLTMLFDFCEISLDYVDSAKKSLEKDSQEGTVLSQNAIGHFKKVAITDELRAEANTYLSSFKLSVLGKPVYLPNVLSPTVAQRSHKSKGHPAAVGAGGDPGADNSASNGYITITLPA